MREITRRQALAVLGAGVLAADGVVLGDGQSSAWWRDIGAGPVYRLSASGYAPDGTAGATAAYPLAAVRLLDSARSALTRGGTEGLPAVPRPGPDAAHLQAELRASRPPRGRSAAGRAPDMQVRGHTTGHLLSGLALTYASTGDPRAKATGEYLVGELAQLQASALRSPGTRPATCRRFPKSFFDWLEAGQTRVWSPYYMIHKYLAGHDRPVRAGRRRAGLDVAARLADWVDARTARLSYAHMQHVLETEFGGLPESLANLYRITGSERYLRTAQRFYHAQVPRSARGGRRLAARGAVQRQPAEGDRQPPDVGGDRRAEVPRHRVQLLADRHRALLVRHRRAGQLRALDGA